MLKRAVFAVLAVLLGLAAVLGVLEVALRFADLRPRIAPLDAGALRLSENPVLQYEYIPGYADLRGGPAAERINALGFRDVEHAAEKAPGVTRVVALGDSVTVGLGAALDDIYPRRLEERLRARGRYEVLAMAAPGYNTLQEAELLRTRGEALAPDIVVVAFVLNDFDPGSGIAHDLAARLGAAPPALTAEWLAASGVGEEDAVRLAERFRAQDAETLALWLRGPRLSGAWERLAGRTYLGAWIAHRAFAARLARRPETLDPGDPYEGGVVGAGFGMIARLAEARGFRTLVAIVPLFGEFPSWEAYPEENETAEIRARNLAEDRGLPVLNLRPALAAAGSPKALSVDPAHPNALGHRVIADALAAEFERRGW